MLASNSGIGPHVFGLEPRLVRNVSVNNNLWQISLPVTFAYLIKSTNVCLSNPVIPELRCDLPLLSLIVFKKSLLKDQNLSDGTDPGWAAYSSDAISW